MNKEGLESFWDDKSREVSSIRDVKEILINEGYQIIADNNDNRYDLEVVNKEKETKYVEIKQDFTCAKTGNVGVEYECRGKPSGIMVSKADMYFYKIYEGQTIRIIQVTKNKLKMAINQILQKIQDKKEKQKIAEQMKFDYTPTPEKKGKKPGFFRTLIKSTNGDYELEYKLINGGDLGSNSLNIIIPKEDFFKFFTLKKFVERKMDNGESKDLSATLQKSKDRMNLTMGV